MGAARNGRPIVAGSVSRLGATPLAKLPFFVPFCSPTAQTHRSTIDRFDGRTDDEKMAQRPGGSGVGAAGAHLHQVLQDCNLLEYEPLLLEEGEAFVTPLATARRYGCVSAKPAASEKALQLVSVLA